MLQQLQKLPNYHSASWASKHSSAAADETALLNPIPMLAEELKRYMQLELDTCNLGNQEVV